MTLSLTEIYEQILQQEAVLVDVREQEEWDLGHLAGARLLPLSALEKGQATIELPGDLPLYLYCRRGMRAKRAQDLLQSNFPLAKALKEGFEELLKAGFKRST